MASFIERQPQREVPKFSPDSAIEFMLGEPRKLYGDVTTRGILDDTQFGLKIRNSFESPRQQGEALFSLLNALPVDETVWRTHEGIPTYSSDFRVVSELTIVSNAGTNPEVARTFCDNLKRQAASGDQQAFLKETPADRLVTGVIRALNNPESDIQAITTLVEAFGSRFSEANIGEIIQRYYYSLSHMPIDTQSSIGYGQRVVKFADTIAAMLNSKTVPDATKDTIREVVEPIEEEIALQKEQKMRSEQIAIAKKSLHSGFVDDAAYDSYEQLVDEIGSFDRKTATILRIQGLYSASQTEQLSHILRVRTGSALQMRFERYIEARQQGEKVSQEIIAVLGDILTSQSRNAQSDGELDRLKEQAKGLGRPYDYIESRQSSIRELRKEEEQRRKDLELLGIANPELPSGVSGLEVSLPSAYLKYDDVDTIIADIHRYFIGENPSDDESGMYSKARQSTGNPSSASLLTKIASGSDETARIFSSLSEELREWGGKSSESFIHSEASGGGSAYKYSGSTFEGNTIVVTRDNETNSFRMDIQAGGNGYNYRDPSYLLRDFAERIGKCDALMYTGEPTIGIVVDPSKSDLDNVLQAYPHQFVSSENNKKIKYHSSTISVDVQAAIDYYSLLMGIPGTHTISRLDDNERHAINDRVQEGRIRALQQYPSADGSEKSLEVDTENSGKITINFDTYSLPPEPYFQLSGNGQADVAILASYRPFDKTEAPISMKLPTLSMTYIPSRDIQSQTATNERVRRAISVRRLLRSRWNTKSDDWKKTSSNYITTNFTFTNDDTGANASEYAPKQEDTHVPESERQQGEAAQVTSSSEIPPPLSLGKENTVLLLPQRPGGSIGIGHNQLEISDRDAA